MERDVNPYSRTSATRAQTPVQSTVSQCHQTLALLEHQFYDEHSEGIELGFDECCGLRFTLAGIRDALIWVVEELDKP